MNPNPWLEKAERLRFTIASLRQVGSSGNETGEEGPAAIERLAIAHWLRQEFSDEPPEDTATLPLFFTHL